ncbi:NINE protein [bacterium]|nr:NINE protein [bacterium]
MKHEDLMRLKELQQKGLITEEEFTDRYERLLRASNSTHYHVEKDEQPRLSKIYHHYHDDVQPYHKTKSKSKILAGLLGIFLGCLGAHNFYTAHYGKGFVQLLITVLSMGYFIILPIVWGLVEGVLILCGLIHEDGHGVELK